MLTTEFRTNFSNATEKTHDGLFFRPDPDNTNPLLDIRGWFLRIERLLLKTDPNVDLDLCINLVRFYLISKLSPEDREKFVFDIALDEWSVFKSFLISQFSKYVDREEFEDAALQAIEFLEGSTRFKIRCIINLLACIPSDVLAYEYLPFVTYHSDLCCQSELLQLQALPFTRPFYVCDLEESLKMVLKRYPAKPNREKKRTSNNRTGKRSVRNIN